MIHIIYIQYFTIDLEKLTEDYSIPFVSKLELDIGKNKCIYYKETRNLLSRGTQ